MRMMTAGLLLAIAAPVGAQTAEPPCAATVLPPEFAGWAKPVAAKSGDAVAIDRGAVLALLPSGDVTFAVASAKPPVAGTFSGTVSFEVKTAGTYRVALSGPVWIDVIGGGKALDSARHGHGPACSPVRKMVDFVLTPGRYALQLSGAKTASVTVLVTRATKAGGAG